MKIKWSNVILLTSLYTLTKDIVLKPSPPSTREKGFNDSARLKLDQLGLQLQLDAIFMQISVAKKKLMQICWWWVYCRGVHMVFIKSSILLVGVL